MTPDDSILTPDEALKILSESGLKLDSYPPEFVTWIETMLRDTEQVAAQIEADNYERMRASITQPMDEKALAAAEQMFRDEARKQAQTFVTQMTTEQLKVIGQTISDGLAEGIGPREMARRLDSIKNLDAVRAERYQKEVAYYKTLGLSDEELTKMSGDLYNKLLRERKENIARTEARHATEASQEQNAKVRGAKYKVWISTQDGKVSPNCAANEAQGPIPIDDDFISGVNRPPQHPNCRCTLSFITAEDQRQRAAERAKQRSQKTREAQTAANK